MEIDILNDTETQAAPFRVFGHLGYIFERTRVFGILGQECRSDADSGSAHMHFQDGEGSPT